MNPMLYIRKAILGLSQAEMAEVAGVAQGTVSRWENGLLKPSRDEMEAIRKFAIAQAIAWDDAWFFDSNLCGNG